MNQPEPSAASRCARNFASQNGPKSSFSLQTLSVVSLCLTNINQFSTNSQNYTSRIEATSRILEDEAFFGRCRIAQAANNQGCRGETHSPCLVFN